MESAYSTVRAIGDEDKLRLWGAIEDVSFAVNHVCRFFTILAVRYL